MIVQASEDIAYTRPDEDAIVQASDDTDCTRSTEDAINQASGSSDSDPISRTNEKQSQREIACRCAHSIHSNWQQATRIIRITELQLVIVHVMGISKGPRSGLKWQNFRLPKHPLATCLCSVHAISSLA